MISALVMAMSGACTRQSAPSRAGLGAEARHGLEGGEELGAAVGIAGVVERVHAGEQIARAEHLGPGERVAEEERVARRHVGDRDVAAHGVDGAILGHRDVARVSAEPPIQRRSTVGDAMLDGAERARHARRRVELDGVALAVAERQRVAGEAVGRAPSPAPSPSRARRRAAPPPVSCDASILPCPFTSGSPPRSPPARASTTKTPRSTITSTSGAATTCAGTARWPRASWQPRGKRAILELGCGSGRAALPLVRDGWRVVGVDAVADDARRAAAARLERVRRRAACELRARRLSRARARAPLPARDLPVQRVHAPVHARGRRALPRGRARAPARRAALFAFDVMNPDLAWLSRDPTRRWARTRFRHPRTGKLAYLLDEPDLRRGRCRSRSCASTTSRRQAGATRMVRLTHRQFFPLELEALLHYNGFVVEAHEGGFDGGALVPESEEQVLQLSFPSRNFGFSTEKHLTSVFARPLLSSAKQLLQGGSGWLRRLQRLV